MSALRMMLAVLVVSPFMPGSWACADDDDCVDARKCVDGMCINPCNTACGQNVECKVLNHQPTCTCLPGYTGDATKTCTLLAKTGCGLDNQCPVDQSCVNQVCVNPCTTMCGVNTICQVINHAAMCACKSGYTGNPFTGCTSPERMRCVVDNQCPVEKACVNQDCVDPCLTMCGVNTNCQVINHSAFCTCKSGYTGNTFTGCTPTEARGECSSNDNCPRNQVCISQKCVDPCVEHCGPNTVCKVTNHIPTCACNEGFSGNPLEECKPQNYSNIWPPSSKGKKKFYLNTSVTAEWHGAYMMCLRNNTRLARIESKEENDEVLKLIKGTNLRLKEFWTAGTDHAEEGKWFWLSTGQPVKEYTNWHGGNPNNFFEEDCLDYWEFDFNIGYKWNDANCWKHFHFICEYYD